MSMQQYTETCYKLSKTITRDYSTSFSLGIHMLDRSYHPAIYAIYGFVRLADEIVDTFHGHDKLNIVHYASLQALNKKRSTILKSDIMEGIRREFRKQEKTMSVVAARG